MFPAHTQGGAGWSGCVPHAHPGGSRWWQPFLGVYPPRAQAGLGVCPQHTQESRPVLALWVLPPLRSARLTTKPLGVWPVRAQTPVGVFPAHTQPAPALPQLPARSPAHPSSPGLAALGVFPAHTQPGLPVHPQPTQGLWVHAPSALPAALCPPPALGVYLAHGQKRLGVILLRARPPLPTAPCLSGLLGVFRLRAQAGLGVLSLHGQVALPPASYPLLLLGVLPPPTPKHLPVDRLHVHSG